MNGEGPIKHFGTNSITIAKDLTRHKHDDRHLSHLLLVYDFTDMLHVTLPLTSQLVKSF